jgi:hypothetical protein
MQIDGPTSLEPVEIKSINIYYYVYIKWSQNQGVLFYPQTLGLNFWKHQNAIIRPIIKSVYVSYLTCKNFRLIMIMIIHVNQNQKINILGGKWCHELLRFILWL